jgi:voltage-gated potassium channel
MSRVHSGGVLGFLLRYRAKKSDVGGIMLKQRVWEIVEVSRPEDRVSHKFDVFILGLIFVNVVAVILETEPTISSKYGPLLHALEIFSIVIFSIEYLLRIWSCVVVPKYHRPFVGRIRFALTPMALIDLVAVLPFYLFFLGLDLRFIRVVRLIRVLRVAKLARYLDALNLMGRVAKARKEELVVTSILMLFLLIIASALMYYAENTVQPDIFPSIMQTMWWAVATLTTVGYGDVYPVTNIGRFLASVVAILGVGFFALPIGILGSGFVEEIHKRHVKSYCPHCGLEITEESNGD